MTPLESVSKGPPAAGMGVPDWSRRVPSGPVENGPLVVALLLSTNPVEIYEKLYKQEQKH